MDEDDIFGDDVAAPVAATVPLMNMGGGGGDLSATHSGGHLHSHQTHQNSQNSSQARQAPLRYSPLTLTPNCSCPLSLSR